MTTIDLYQLYQTKFRFISQKSYGFKRLGFFSVGRVHA